MTAAEHTPPSDATPRPLGVEDHSRDAAGLTYVYPVVSRRSGGVSVGINLNPNNACNWACIYCQVPDLVRGAAPPIDLDLLEHELRTFLARATTAEWMERNAPEGARRITDIAFSGNGEPTTAAAFDEIVACVLAVRAEFDLDVKTVLITNGSQIHRPGVADALRAMAAANGEVWFKVDRATQHGRAEVNRIDAGLERVAPNLALSAASCRTKVQTCMFRIDGQPPSDDEVDAYVAFLRDQVDAGTPLAGVLLYGLARPSMQPDAQRLTRLDESWLNALAERVTRETGLDVSVHP